VNIQKNLLLVSPSGKIGGKASFTQRLLDVYNKHNVKYNHIDLVRANSNNRFIRVLEHTLSFFRYKLRLIGILTTRNIDIVQIHTSTYFDFYDLSLFLIISKCFRKKVFLRYGGGSFPEFYKKALGIQKQYIKWVLKSADTLIVQSEYWKGVFKNIGISEERMFVLPNFVNQKQFEPREKDFLTPELQILFIPATSLKGKGFFDVKDSIVRIAESNPRVTFHVVGPKVDKYIARNNIETYKTVFGTEKIALFNKCHIFLLPTRAEGFPNALIEAMAAGLAVITTHIPSIECLVEHNTHCMLIPPENETEFETTLRTLIENREKIQQLGIAAKKWVTNNYSEDIASSLLQKLYN